jgi:hypothetical protein
MQVFDHQSLLDLVASDRMQLSHVHTLIAEANVMESAYQRSGLARSKAVPTCDWQSGISIPGSLD